MRFERIAILGTGLIGASVGLAIKAARPQAHLVGYDAARDNAQRARRVKAVDSTARLGEAVSQADLVVLAVPVGSMQTMLEEIAPLLKSGAVVTDTGSTKAQVLRWAESILPGEVDFIGGHPMAGKTETGPDAADAALFQGATWCLVPSATASREAIDAVLKLVEALGAVPYFLGAEEHDGLVAAVSHLPYLLSVAMISHLAREQSWREAASLAAGGFAYATHLSDSDPRMFADIVRTNRENVVRRLDLYTAELQALRDSIAADDPGLKQRFEQAQGAHLDWLSGRAQRRTAEGGNGADLPSAGSMMMGSLFGRLGRRDKPER